MSEILNFNASSLLSGDIKNSIVPAGYVRFTLSTKGKVSKAPEVCFARAMTALEVLNLSMYIKDELQGPLINIVDSIIYKTDEKPIASIAEWSSEEVIEFLVRYYSNFFGTTLSETEYTPTKEEEDLLKTTKPDMFAAFINKTWKPKFQLNLSTIDFFPLPEKISNRIVVTDEKNNFSVAFRFPQYGDILLVKQASESYTGEIDKSILLSLFSNVILIEKIQGTDVTSIPLKERLAMVLEDPKFSLSLFGRVNTEFDNIRFGINDNIKIISPVTEKPIERRCQFRVVDVLSAITLFESNDYAVRFE